MQKSEKFNNLTPNPEESEIIGKWIMNDGKIEKDIDAKRIEELISSYLKKIGTDESGWKTLYQDPKDGRFWELSYPNSGSHGGGAPNLKCIDESLIKIQYSIINKDE